jgi:hypothetical protein
MATIWLVFRVKDGDILNCLIATTNRDTARQRLLDVSENDIDEDDAWYRLARYDYLSVLPNKLHIAVRWTESIMTRLEIESIADQYEMLPQHVTDNEDDFWIDDIDLT